MRAHAFMRGHAARVGASSATWLCPKGTASERASKAGSTSSERARINGARFEECENSYRRMRWSIRCRNIKKKKKKSFVRKMFQLYALTRVRTGIMFMVLRGFWSHGRRDSHLSEARSSERSIDRAAERRKRDDARNATPAMLLFR